MNEKQEKPEIPEEQEKRKNSEKPYWEGKHFSFFQNKECEYFPCHRIEDPTGFNCLFCYCPLYMLGPNCGGNFRYTEKGTKDCTGCVIPHLPENYGRIIGKYKEIREMMPHPEDSQKENLSNTNESLQIEAQLDDAHLKDAQTKEAQPADAQLKDAQLKDVQLKGAQQKEAQPADTQLKDAQLKDAQSRNAGRDSGRHIVMMACTERGFSTMRRAAQALKENLPDVQILQTGRCAHVPGFEDGPGLSEVTGKWFREADALVFFAATGIAVRCIAPFVRDKFRDPAVLAVDENGQFVVSLLSGHAGGANRLCSVLARTIGAQPVITTATDGRGLFAVDVFAAENGLQISDRTIAKQISARLLAGDTVTVFAEDFQEYKAQISDGQYGEGIHVTGERKCADIIVSYKKTCGDRTDALYLIPRVVALGIGCRRGISAEAIENAAARTLQEAGIFRKALCGVASIDIKSEEAGLHAFAETNGLPLHFYTAGELRKVPGTFTASAFVKEVTGVDCVCERSAVILAEDMEKSSGNRDKGNIENEGSSGSERNIGDKRHTGSERNIGNKRHTGNTVELIMNKQSLDGVTTALAKYR